MESGFEIQIINKTVWFLNLGIGCLFKMPSLEATPSDSVDLE